MLALLHYSAGILIAHAFWAYFYLGGTLFWTPRFGGPPALRDGARSAVLEIVLATTSGMAITGFCTFALGLLRLLYPATAVALVIALGFAFALLGDSPLRASFWTTRGAALTAAARRSTAALYLLSLVLAVPAVIPESTFDALTFHLVYAVDWASAHRIYVDPWVRFPYYTQNWILIDSWVFTLHLSSYIDFVVGWLPAALMLFGVFGGVISLAPYFSAASERMATVAALLSALAIAFSPIFLRWIDNGMVDVPIGLFFLVSVIATAMAGADRQQRWLYYVLVCFPFLVGMKPSFIVLIPVAAAATWLAARDSKWSVRSAAIAACIALALCLPWYLKNFVQTGDPIAPYLHLALHQHDATWTEADFQRLLPDLAVNRSPLSLLRLPLYAIQDPEGGNFREPGSTFMIGLMFLPGVVLVYALLRRRWHARMLWLRLSAFTFCGVAYWLASIPLGRYALIFIPALALFIGLFALSLGARSRARMALALAVLAVLAVPAPAGADWLGFILRTEFVSIGQTVPSQGAYFLKGFPAYVPFEVVTGRLLRTHVPHPRVYVLGDFEGMLSYYFKLDGITKVGDWFGPGRFSDFSDEIQRSTAAFALAKLQIDAIIIRRNFFPQREMYFLRTELSLAGWEHVDQTDQTEDVYFRPGIPK